MTVCGGSVLGCRICSQAASSTQGIGVFTRVQWFNNWGPFWKNETFSSQKAYFWRPSLLGKWKQYFKKAPSNIFVSSIFVYNEEWMIWCLRNVAKSPQKGFLTKLSFSGIFSKNNKDFGICALRKFPGGGGGWISTKVFLFYLTFWILHSL